MASPPRQRSSAPAVAASNSARRAASWGGQPQGAGAAVRAQRELPHRFHDGSQPAERDGQHAAVGQREEDGIVVLVGEPIQRLRVEVRRRDQIDDRSDEVDRLPVDRHAEMQLQPVDAGAFAQLRLDRAVGADQLEGEVAGHVDLPSGGLQSRQGVVEDLRPGEVVALGEEVALMGGGHAVPQVGGGREALVQQHPHRFGLRAGVALDLHQPSGREARHGGHRFAERDGGVAVAERQPRQRDGLLLDEVRHVPADPAEVEVHGEQGGEQAEVRHRDDTAQAFRLGRRRRQGGERVGTLRHPGVEGAERRGGERWRPEQGRGEAGGMARLDRAQEPRLRVDIDRGRRGERHAGAVEVEAGHERALDDLPP